MTSFSKRVAGNTSEYSLLNFEHATYLQSAVHIFTRLEHNIHHFYNSTTHTDYTVTQTMIAYYLLNFPYAQE